MSVILIIGLTSIAVLIIGFFSAGFWLWLWIGLSLFMLFLNMFYADLIVPIFNKLTPLEEGDLRKKIEKIELDFNYDFNEEKITFDNLRIDNQSNKKIEEIVSNFNSSNKKFLNKITFKNLVNDILIAYFG